MKKLFKEKIESRDLKMNFLRLHLERELKEMRFACSAPSTSKKLKVFFSALMGLKERKVYAVFNEYYSLCKVIYRIKCKINHAWTREYEIEHVIDLVQNNHIFKLLENVAKHMLTNVFEGTSSKEPVLG